LSHAPKNQTGQNGSKLEFAPEALRLVKHAAELQSRSISDFVIAAQEVAHRTIDEAQVIHLSVKDQHRFVELLLTRLPIRLP